MTIVQALQLASPEVTNIIFLNEIIINITGSPSCSLLDRPELIFCFPVRHRLSQGGVF